jgi:hypothetical protein
MVLGARSRLVAPLLAAGLAAIAILTGAQGGDLAAATYRVEMFARSGLSLWDSGWYGGHWTFDYSVLFAPIGWLAGIPLMEIACVAIAAWAFDRLAVGRFGRAGRAGAIVFAVGTVVQVAIGQEPYLLGETLALVALLGARNGLWPVAVALGTATSLASPLAGAFLTMAALAWLIGSWPKWRFAAGTLIAAAAAPLLTLEVLFPGLGTMPFPFLSFLAMLLGLAALGLAVARRERTVAVGVALYALAVIAAFAVPSAVGNNITRLGVSFGVAFVVMLAWGQRRRRTIALLLAAAIPLALSQWLPAGNALLGDGNASTRAAYFRPLVSFLRRVDRPLGRVEVVPTALHWEAAYVAPYFPLARGWERQLDTGANPIFYVPGALSAASYHAWLFANGVRFVALPNVPLDYAAVAEGKLVRAGVPGLRLLWHSAIWRVYAVVGASGIVSGPARLISSSGSELRLKVARAGTIVVRERYLDAWRVASGAVVIGPARGGWLRLRATRPGRVVLRIKL